MHYCCVKLCGKNTKNSGVQKNDISFHRFPKCLRMKELWINAARNGDDWLPRPTSVVCSRHFRPECFVSTKSNRRMLSYNAVPTLHLPAVVNEPNAQPLPGPSRIPTTQTSDTNEQCRFCGEFTKCVPVSNKPYISNNTSLAFNDVAVQLDFNDGTLPKTVCQACDAKLTEMYDFVKVVKAAQESLINVAEPRQVYVEIDPRKDYETLVVKIEYNDDEKDEDDGNDESKDRIVDSLTIGETIFIKEEVNRKRKSKTAGPKNQKKAKVTEVKVKSENEDELIMDIKEEVIERDANDLESDTGCFVRDTGCYVSGTGTDAKPSEVALATSALVFGMRSDGSGYGYS